MLNAFPYSLSSFSMRIIYSNSLQWFPSAVICFSYTRITKLIASYLCQIRIFYHLILNSLWIILPWINIYINSQPTHSSEHFFLLSFSLTDIYLRASNNRTATKTKLSSKNTNITTTYGDLLQLDGRLLHRCWSQNFVRQIRWKRVSIERHRKHCLYSYRCWASHILWYWPDQMRVWAAIYSLWPELFY